MLLVVVTVYDSTTRACFFPANIHLIKRKWVRQSAATHLHAWSGSDWRCLQHCIAGPQTANSSWMQSSRTQLHAEYSKRIDCINPILFIEGSMQHTPTAFADAWQTSAKSRNAVKERMTAETSDIIPLLLNSEDC